MLELPGMMPEIYDAINERIEFPGTVPEGLETHIAGVEETGMRVVVSGSPRSTSKASFREALASHG